MKPEELSIERLEKLKQLVLNGLYTNETGDEEVFEHYYTVSTFEQADLIALIDSAIAEQSKPKTKFEAWKQSLTIEGEETRRQADHCGTICYDCPAQSYCESSNFNKNTECGDAFKEWGEQDADK